MELIDQQFQVLNANENDMYKNGQRFGLSYGANQESNLTNEGEVGIDLSDFNADDIVDDLNLFEEEDVTL